MVDRGVCDDAIFAAASFCIDGSKGLCGAVTKAFRKRVVVGRCQWHKRENVLSYLSKSGQALWRKRLQRAYDRPTDTQGGA